MEVQANQLQGSGLVIQNQCLDSRRANHLGVDSRGWATLDNVTMEEVSLPLISILGHHQMIRIRSSLGRVLIRLQDYPVGLVIVELVRTNLTLEVD